MSISIFSILQIGTSIFYLIYVILLGFGGKKWTKLAWILGQVGNFFYLPLVLKAHFVSEFLLLVVYILLTFRNIVHYSRVAKTLASPETSKSIVIRSLSYRHPLFWISLLVWTAGIYYWHDFVLWLDPEARVVTLDAITSLGSLYATFLSSYGILQSWILWIIINILYVIQYTQASYAILSAYSLILVLLSWRGYAMWKKKKNMEIESDAISQKTDV